MADRSVEESRTAAPRKSSENTRRLVLDAAIECLSTNGFSGTSTVDIAKRAGVSRGAQTHHFPTRNALLTEAIERLATRRLEQVERNAAELPRDEHWVSGALDLFRETFVGPLFEASLELEVAARTDPNLMAVLRPVEQSIGRRIRQTMRNVLGPELADGDEFVHWFHFVWSTLRGMASLRSFERGGHLDEDTWRFCRPILVGALTGQYGATTSDHPLPGAAQSASKPTREER